MHWKTAPGLVRQPAKTGVNRGGTALELIHL